MKNWKQMAAFVLGGMILASTSVVVPVQAGASDVKLKASKASLTINEAGTAKADDSTVIVVKKAKGVVIKKTTYKSKNTKVATVTNKGFVSAHQAGNTTIVVTVKYVRKKKTMTKKLNFKVTVKTDGTANGNASVKKNKSDEAALKELIKEQVGRGASVNEDINAGSYTWDAKSGRLTKLIWQGLHLSGSISFAKLTALEEINVGNFIYNGYEGLSSIDVSKNTALKDLRVDANQKLSGLDVTNNVNLESLDCSGIQLKHLDVSRCSKLTYLRAAQNQLTEVDVSKNPKLYTLDCNENQLKSLDLSKNTELANLACEQNQLASLDLSTNSKLCSLSCGMNQLQKLVVRDKPQLYEMSCTWNYITSLEVSGNPALESLYCDANDLTSLDLKGDTKLHFLKVDNGVDLQNVPDGVEITRSERVVRDGENVGGVAGDDYVSGGPGADDDDTGYAGYDTDDTDW